MDINIREITIRSLRSNNGEVDGLPRNPRRISKKNLEKLKKSVQDAPEMLRLRELIAVEYGGEFVVICGNQRLEAAKALGMDTLPVKVLPADTPVEKLREYVIKDNLPFGEDDWEILSTDWDINELEEWGVETAFMPGDMNLDAFFEEDEYKKDKDIVIQVILPLAIKDKEEDIRKNIQLTLAEYGNIKIK